MNRSKSKRVTRKKVIPLHFQKSQASLSQILTTASYKKRVKELQKNNKVLAVALQDARLDLANSNKLLQQCSNDDAKILFAKTKLKDMVICIQTLVSGLNEVMCCLDLKPLSLFNSSPDEVRLKIRQPDLDPIEESSSVIEDSNINVSLPDRDSLGPIISEQGVASERTSVSGIDNSVKDIFGVQTVVQLDDAQIGLNTVVEDQGTTGRQCNSIPFAPPPPDSPLTPELEITHSAEYFKQLMDLNLISRSPKKDLIPKSKAKLASPVKGHKGMSRIPMRKKNPLPLQSIDFSPPASTINRKTFVVKDVPISSGMEETFVGHNSARDLINHSDRRGTYLLAAVPETTAIDSISPIDPGVKVPDATIYFNEDMELTGVIPIHNLPLTKKNTVQTFNATTLCSNNLQFNDSVAKSIDNIVTMEPEHPLSTNKPEPSKLTSDKQDSLDESIFSVKKTTSKDISPKFKCPDFNEDMELTGLIPIHNLPQAKFNIISVQPEYSVATSKPDSSKLIYDNLDSLNESVLFGKDITATSKDNSPKSGDSKVIRESLKRKSISSNEKVSFKTKGGKVSDREAKKTLSRKRRSSVNSKQIASPKSPQMSREVCLRAVSPKKLNVISKTACRKSTREKCKTAYKKYFSSDSDSDNETSSKKKKAVQSKISHSPKSNMPTNLIETASHSELNSVSETASHSEVNSVSDVSSKKAKGSISFKDSESASDCSFKDDFKSFGRCNLKNPKKTSKRRGPYTFKKYNVQFDQSNYNERENVQTMVVEATGDVTVECSTSLEIKHTSPQNLNISKSYLKRNSFSESSDNADKEIPGVSENLSPLLKSSKTSNKDVDKSSKRHNPNQKSLKLKFSDQKTDTDNEIIETDSKSSKQVSTVSCPKEKSRAVEVESDSAFDVISSPVQTRVTRAGSSKIVSSRVDNEKNTINSDTSTCRKSVQFAVDDCYNAFQGLKNKEQLMSEHKGNLNASKEIGKVKGSRQHSSSRLSAVFIPGILKKRPTSQQKLGKKISCGNNSSSIDNIEKQNDNQLKHSQTEANNKLDELLASLDSTFDSDSGCSSKGKTPDPDSALQSTEGDKIKRPFSGVSERRSKKRATDNSSDVFIEIENMCSQEIHPKCLVTAQQCQTGKVSDDCEETEICDQRDIIKAKDLETGSKQCHSHQSKSKPKELKGEEKCLNSQNVKNNMQVVQDALVGNDSAKSSNQTDKMPCKKDDLIVLKNDKKKKNKKCMQNSEVDILIQIKTTPLKTIQLPSTEACTLNEINTQGGKTFDKQKPKKVKNSSAQKETKTKSKDLVSSSVCELTQIKKGNEILNVPNLQPVVLEALPICLTTENDSSTYSKDSTSLGNERPRRTRPLKSFKEPSLNCKMRR